MDKGPSKYPYVWTGVIEKAEEGKAGQMRYKIGGKWMSCWHKSFPLLEEGKTTDVGDTITESNGKTYNNIHEIGDLGTLKATAEAPKEDKLAPKGNGGESPEKSNDIRRQASSKAAAKLYQGKGDVWELLEAAYYNMVFCFK